MNKPWTAQETETLVSLYELRMNTQISKLLPGRSADAVKQKARSLCLKSNRKVTRKRYELDYGYFKTPNLENSYWAGFIAADGCIDDVKDRVRIKLLDSDKRHLEAFQGRCGCTSPIRNAPNGSRDYAALEIMGTGRWREDLERNFCITARKTLTLQPPRHLPRELSLAFIIGYIDGDGCIFTEKVAKQPLRVGLQVTSTREVLVWIKGWMNALAPSVRMSRVAQTGKVCSYKIVGRKTESVLRTLLALPTPKLERKWLKAAEFLHKKEEDARCLTI